MKGLILDLLSEQITANEELPMEDLWRVQSSAVDMKDLADIAEYHRFLDRFRQEEMEGHRSALLYGEASFGAASQAKNED